MKKTGRFILLLVLLLSPVLLCGADDALVVDEGKEEAAFDTSSIEVGLKELREKNRKMGDEIMSLKEAVGGLESSVNSMSETVKKTEESGMEIKNLAGDVESLKKRLEIFEEKYAKDSGRTEKFADEFADIKESFRQKIDKMQDWNDVMEVLKKQINNNETEIARMKKAVNGLKRQYEGEEDDAFNSFIRSPYIPAAALLVSIIAFITAMVR